MKNAILIFDEAHNIERTAEDGASFSYTLSDVNDCEKELRNLGKYVKYFEGADMPGSKSRDPNDQLAIAQMKERINKIN